MMNELNLPLLNADAASGAGQPAPQPADAAPVVDQPQNDNATTIPPVMEPATDTANINELTQMLLAQQQQQAQMLAEMRDRLEKAAAPRPEDDLRTEEQKRLDEIASKVSFVQEQIERQENNRIVQAVVSDATTIIDQLASSDPTVRSNPKLMQAVKQEILAIIEPIARANPRGHGLSPKDVRKWFADKVGVYKAVHESWPGQAAVAVQQQAQINNRAVDVGGGSSPTPADTRPAPAPDSDAWWDQKRSKLRAAVEKHTQA